MTRCDSTGCPHGPVPPFYCLPPSDPTPIRAQCTYRSDGALPGGLVAALVFLLQWWNEEGLVPDGAARGHAGAGALGPWRHATAAATATRACDAAGTATSQAHATRKPRSLSPLSHLQGHMLRARTSHPVCTGTICTTGIAPQPMPTTRWPPPPTPTPPTRSLVATQLLRSASAASVPSPATSMAAARPRRTWRSGCRLFKHF